MKVLVIGATGGSGRATVEALLARGHEVSAFARRPQELELRSPHLTLVTGDATRPEDLECAVRGQDAVIVTLGIRENPLAVRLRGSKHTPLDVRSTGTRNVVQAMKAHGVRRLVVQTTYGIGATRGLLPLKWKLLFALLLSPQIADSERQEVVVRESGLDWVVAQPVALTDAGGGELFASADGETRGMSIPRRQVADFLVEAVETPTYLGRSVALSAA